MSHECEQTLTNKPFLVTKHLTMYANSTTYTYFCHAVMGFRHGKIIDIKQWVRVINNQCITPEQMKHIVNSPSTIGYWEFDAKEEMDNFMTAIKALEEGSENVRYY